MKTGEKIRQLRQQKGYSQEVLADELGLSTTAYGDIERGKTDLTLSRLAQISAVLDTNPLTILGAESDPQTERLTAQLEKQSVALQKAELEATYWKEKYEERLRLEEFGAQITHAARQRIGFEWN